MPPVKKSSKKQTKGSDSLKKKLAEKDKPSTGKLPLFVLQLVKGSQQQHGLRHENFQRYRGYCSRRIQRIRRALKFTHSYKCVPNRTARFVPKPITAEQLTDSRYLEICVFEVERNWAYYKQLKIEYEQKHPRRIFHARLKLRRAVKCGKSLMTIVGQNEELDELTRNELVAYTTFIEALLRVELAQYDNAVSLLETSKSTYETLKNLASKSPDIVELYVQRTREIDFLLGACRGDATALLGGVNALSLEMDVGVEKEEEKIAETATKKKSKNAEKIEARPMKPFFFDLALNFVDNPDAFK